MKMEGVAEEVKKLEVLCTVVGKKNGAAPMGWIKNNHYIFQICFYAPKELKAGIG